MRRREFIVALAGAGVIWPEVGRAQHRKIWRIGYLTPGFWCLMESRPAIETNHIPVPSIANVR
jgi:hypothetical protein